MLSRIPRAAFALFVLLVNVAFILLWYNRLFVSLPQGPTRLATRIAYNLPVIGRVAKKKDCHTALTMLSRMLQCGAPMDVALARAAATNVHPRIKSAIERARLRVINGDSLESAFAQEKALPRGLRRLSGVHKAGSLLPAVLERLAEQYRREAARTARIAMNIAFPAMVCLIGAMVFVLYGGIFSAINGLSTGFLEHIWKY